MDKATPTKQAELIAKLRYMGKQYAAGQVARGGSPQKHYLEEAAEEIEMMAWALSMNTKTPASAQENADLRNVIQAACIDGLPGLSRAWEKYFPDHPITIKGAEVERLAAQAAPTELKDSASQLRKVLGISQDFSDWPYAKLMDAATKHILSTFDKPEEFTQGVNAAAKMLDKMADDFSNQHAWTDPDTGVAELTGAKEEYYNTLRELADSVRSIVHEPKKGNSHGRS